VSGDDDEGGTTASEESLKLVRNREWDLSLLVE